jgi:hypothetical protein
LFLSFIIFINEVICQVNFCGFISSLCVEAFLLDFENLGADDPRCPLAGLKIPVERASKVYGEAHFSDKFKVRLKVADKRV